jgi:hypothetical protein
VIPFDPIPSPSTSPVMGELFNRVQDKIKRALDKAVSSDIQATSIGDLLASLGTGILQQVVTGGVGVLSATATVAQDVLFGGTNGKFSQSSRLQAIITATKSTLTIGGNNLGNSFGQLILLGGGPTNPARIVIQAPGSSDLAEIWLIGDLGFSDAVGVAGKRGSADAFLPKAMTIGNISTGGGASGGVFAVVGRGSDLVNRAPFMVTCITGPDLKTEFSVDSKLGFFGAAAVVQQTGGAATAGATYTATEQGMINRMYVALQALGFIT